MNIRQTLGRAMSTSRIRNTLRKSGNLMYRVISEGHWSMDNQRAATIRDPGKFEWFVNRQGMILPKRFEQRIISYKELDAYQFFASGEFRKALDSLVFGGGLRWRAAWQNLVVNEGLDHLLDVTLSGGTQDTSWWVGLLAASPTPLGSWTATEIGTNDFVTYDEATLFTYGDNAVSSQSIANGTSADFTISSDTQTIGGAFLIQDTTKATPAGTVYAAGAFTSPAGNKAADTGDVLQVTATFTEAAA